MFFGVIRLICILFSLIIVGWVGFVLCVSIW